MTTEQTPIIRPFVKIILSVNIKHCLYFQMYNIVPFLLNQETITNTNYDEEVGWSDTTHPYFI